MHKVMRFVPIGIILAASLGNIWPLIAGYANTPPGKVFLGTVHHPADYFYYLSQFAQGKASWLLARDLYSSEPFHPSFVGWVNVLLGKIFSLIGIRPQTAYGVSTAVLTLLVFTAAWKLIRTVSQTRCTATTGLILFSLFHAFPLMREGKPSYHDYWNNIAIPHVRIGCVPHQLLTVLLSFLAARLIITEKPSKTLYIALFCIGALLSSLQPVQWLLITVISFFVYLIQKKSLTFSVVFGLGGLIPALYLFILFRSVPFSQLKAWEAIQQNSLTLMHFLQATGPVFLVALFSIPGVLSSRTTSVLFTVFYSLMTIILFLSPIPKLLGISHVRVLSALSVLCLSVIAAQGIIRLKHIGIAVALVLTALLVPVQIRSVRLSSTFSPSNAYHYLPEKEYRFLISAASYSTDPDDTFLVLWPYNTIFPGITGKRSFHGHPLLTLNAEQKDARTEAFFSGAMQTDSMLALLTEGSIDYIIAYRQTPNLDHMPILTYVTGTDTLVVYKVNVL